jgi:hypothetical protein
MNIDVSGVIRKPDQTARRLGAIGYFISVRFRAPYHHMDNYSII